MGFFNEPPFFHLSFGCEDVEILMNLNWRWEHDVRICEGLKGNKDITSKQMKDGNNRNGHFAIGLYD